MSKYLISNIVVKNLFYSILFPAMMLLYPIVVSRPHPKDENFVLFCKILSVITFLVGCAYGLRGISLLYAAALLGSLCYFVYSDVMEIKNTVNQAISAAQSTSKAIVDLRDKVNESLQNAGNILTNIDNTKETAEKAIGEFNEVLKKAEETVEKEGAAVDSLNTTLNTATQQVKGINPAKIPQVVPSINKVNNSLQKVGDALSNTDGSNETAKKAISGFSDVLKKAETTADKGGVSVGSLKSTLNTVTQQIKDANPPKIPQAAIANIASLNPVQKINFKLSF